MLFLVLPILASEVALLQALNPMGGLSLEILKTYNNNSLALSPRANYTD
jgi:hypothetical protein